MPKREQRVARRRADELVRLLRNATGEDSLCDMFHLTPGAVMGVMVNHPQKDRDIHYQALKSFLMDLPGMEKDSLMMGHCPEAAYKTMNHLCQLAKKTPDTK